METVRSGSSDEFLIELALTANEEKIFTTDHDAHSTASGDNTTIEATLEIPYVYPFSEMYFYLFFNLIFITQGRSEFVVAQWYKPEPATVQHHSTTSFKK